MRKQLFTLLAVAALATPVLAKDAMEYGDWYGEMGYTMLKANSNILSNSFKPTMLRGVLGTSLTPWLNGELLLGIGLKGEDATIRPDLQLVDETRARNQDVKTLFGLYVTPTYKIADVGRVYARLGWANNTSSDAKVKPYMPGTIPAGTGTIHMARVIQKRNSASYGVGAAFDINESFSVGADYMVYYKYHGEKIDGLTIGLGYKF